MFCPPGLHNKVPRAVVDKIELPQLLVTLTTGAAGTDKGAATLEPARLVQPLMVWVTVYVPAVVTVIGDVVCPPGLHNKVPGAVVDNTELPQLLVTTTIGVAGTVKGAAMPEPARLVQPLMVWVTVYVPGVVTDIEVVV